MNVSSVKNLNGETFSAVQDAELTEVVQTNSASWGAGSTPTYEYTQNGLISAIDTSGLYATSALESKSANILNKNGVIGAGAYFSDNSQANHNVMMLNPTITPFGTTSGIYSPLQYAAGAVTTYGSSSYNTQYFGGFLKGNEWYISNATAGQALRGETHKSRGVHLSGATTAGYSFDLGISGVSGKNDTDNGYNWKLERGCVSGKGINGEWRYGPAEDTALRTISALEYNAVDEISGIAGSAIAQYGADETVLWEGNLSAKNVEISLSDSLKNFDSYKVFGYNTENKYGIVNEYTYNSAGPNWFSLTDTRIQSNNYLTIYGSYVSANTDWDKLQITYMSNKFCVSGGLTHSTAFGVAMTKIVGINRKA